MPINAQQIIELQGETRRGNISSICSLVSREPDIGRFYGKILLNLAAAHVDEQNGIRLIGELKYLGVDCQTPIDSGSKEGKTLIYIAAENGRTRTLEYLLNANDTCKQFEISHRNSGHFPMVQGSAKGITPLCAAAAGGHEATVALMVEKGVEFKQAMTVGVYSGKLPLDVARELNSAALIKWQDARSAASASAAAPEVQANRQVQYPANLEVPPAPGAREVFQRESVASALSAPQPSLQSLSMMGVDTLEELYATQCQQYKALERLDPNLEMIEQRMFFLQEIKRTRDQLAVLRQPVSFDYSGLVSGDGGVAFFRSDTGGGDVHSQSMPQMQQTRAAVNAHLPEQLPVLPQPLRAVPPLMEVGVFSSSKPPEVPADNSLVEPAGSEALVAVSVFSSPKSPEVPADNSLTELTSPEFSDATPVMPGDDGHGDLFGGALSEYLASIWGSTPPPPPPIEEHPLASPRKRRRGEDSDRRVENVGSEISPLLTSP